MAAFTIKTHKGSLINFGVYPIVNQATWNDVSGLYMFCQKQTDGRMKIFYIGQAKSFKDRFSNHERWAEAHKLGADHVLACVVQDQSLRDKQEKELIETFNPTLNVQHKSETGIQSKPLSAQESLSLLMRRTQYGL